MTAITFRDYAGPQDLRAMQALTQRIWGWSSRNHVGDLAWQRFEHLDSELGWKTRLWSRGDQVAAWAWIYEPDRHYLAVDPAEAGLMDVVLDWLEAEAEVATPVVLDTDLGALAILDRRGYAEAVDEPYHLLNRRRLDDLPAQVLPDGFRALSMAQLRDPERRAEAHRAAWSRVAGREHEPPGRSRVTGESYRNVMAAWPYLPELDWVIEAPDGRLVANYCIWLDEANGVGEFEPTGTDADFRRQGLGAAVCVAGLHALRAAGAEWAVVGARGDDGYPIPRKLYYSLGFQTYARERVFQLKRLA